MWVAADAEEMAEVERKKRLYDGIGVRTEVVGERELAEAEPHLRPGLAGALLVPDDSVVYPPCAAKFLLRGIPVLRERALAISGAGITLRGGRLLAAGITVNATGAWAPELTPGIAVRRRKGHLLITDRYPGFVKHVLVELGYLKSAHSTTADSVAFNAQPRKTGQVLLGSSRQFGSESTAIEAPMLARMLRRCQEYMPGLADLAAVRTWTGFRAATPDKLPLMARCPATSGYTWRRGMKGSASPRHWRQAGWWPIASWGARRRFQRGLICPAGRWRSMSKIAALRQWHPGDVPPGPWFPPRWRWCARCTGDP